MNLSNTTILLKEWLRLSGHESEAIAAKEWTVLNDLLDQKNRIKVLLEDYEGEDFSEADKLLVNELITITRRNQILLKSEMDIVSSRIRTEDRSLNTIRKISQTYGSQGGGSYWHSYS
jgi:Na+-transporting NADH:ubiquinone oxidoreductase subunit NqrC